MCGEAGAPRSWISGCAEGAELALSGWYTEVYSMVKSVSSPMITLSSHFHWASSSKTMSREMWTRRVIGS
ncbi:hypothetical protein E2562_007917 [Oryza meyeriana var. granulata]|uniref:Uncharacterized protein n=1 Tax=Oryza meyeriana var. granulata TaxID=110450 RepID=A0A6G1DY82_9ORYZ|nr:hypothetical protein E2562_007917 [Oryza meyeriana var. granulata]